MGKRSNFKRRPQDAYDTPREAVVPLASHLPATFTYWEPCAGAGDLIEAMTGGNCVAATDIEPRPAKGFEWIVARDALSVTREAVDFVEADYIITNPPWTRQILHPMIQHFTAMRPTWLLFDAAWAHTKQAAPYLPMCQKIVSVGRVSWMQNGTSSLDDCAWYLFDANNTSGTRFFGRAA